MTAIATIQDARARAARIRAGIGAYLTTLADVSAAYAERDWEAMGYESWEEYVDGEYSEQRLKLSPEHRQKAVAELRLAGMSQRAIGAVLGVSQKTVDRDLDAGESNDSPAAAPVTGTDGKTYAPTRPARPKAEPKPEPEIGEPRPVEPPKHQEHADAALANIDEAEAIRAEVADALDKFVPDPDAPKRQWQLKFLTALGPGFKLMAQFPVEDVVEQADDECLDELARLAESVVSYRDRVRAALPVPGNVRHLRAVS